MKILLTGGAGYIGSHVAVKLLAKGFRVVVIDNLSNSSLTAIDRIERISGRSLLFVKGDIRDEVILARLFSEHTFDAVVHLAGLKSVSDSIQTPLMYYENNVCGSGRLLGAMDKAGVRKFVFSSSATVYGRSALSPISEDAALGDITNPYGRTKLLVENMLHDLAAADPRWRIAVLRYFNPVGAHESGLLGEDPSGVPANLFPILMRVAMGKTPELFVYGGDYSTPDGTGVRDYIHVVDLAEGHVSALAGLHRRPGVSVWNLGAGKGYSVLEVIREFESITGIKIRFQLMARRPGDVASCFSDPSKAMRDLDWRARRGLSVMLRDAWRWQQMNPSGYASPPA